MEFAWIHNLITLLTSDGGVIIILGGLLYSFARWKTRVDADRENFKAQLALDRENAQRQIDELKEITRAIRDVLLERNEHSVPE